ncbi:YqaA family protein [Bisgaard Taxon 45]
MLAWFSWIDWQSHSLWLMFGSAFLSATVLPGNSEIVFVALVTPLLLLNQSNLFSSEVLWLFNIAVVGNSLGSLTTYCLGYWLPQLAEKQQQHPDFNWVLQKVKRYGIWSLLFSWLPIVGDLFCVLAGWLRLNILGACVLIFLGKLARYLFLLLLTMKVIS